MKLLFFRTYTLTSFILAALICFGIIEAKPQSLTRRSDLSLQTIASRVLASSRVQPRVDLKTPVEVHGVTPGLLSPQSLDEHQDDSFKRPQGNLVYTLHPLVGGKNSLVIQNVPDDEVAGGANSVADVYPKIDGPVRKKAFQIQAWHPQYSPDGKHILLHINDKSFSGYSLYVLNAANRKISLLCNATLSNQFSSWSPNGRLVAYIEGGDDSGDTSFTGPAILSIVDLGTGKSWHVAYSSTFGGDYICSWRKNDLIYSLLEPGGVVSPSNPAQQKEMTRNVASVKRPSVYSYSLNTHKSTLIAKDAYRPCVSPDDQWITFFGSEHPEQPYTLDQSWQYVSHNASLCIMKADGSGRKALNREPDLYPVLHWLSDSKHFISLRQTQGSPDNVAEILEWDPFGEKVRSITSIKSTDSVERDYSYLNSIFRLMSVSRDDKRVYISSYRTIGVDVKKNLAVIQKEIRVVYIPNGKSKTVAISDKDLWGWDWIEK